MCSHPVGLHSERCCWRAFVLHHGRITWCHISLLDTSVNQLHNEHMIGNALRLCSIELE